MPKNPVFLDSGAHLLEALQSVLDEKRGLPALQAAVENLARTLPVTMIRLGVPAAETRMRALFWFHNGRPVQERQFWELLPGQRAALLADAGLWHGPGADGRAVWLAVRLGERNWWGSLEVLVPDGLQDTVDALTGLLQQAAGLLSRDFLLWYLQETLENRLRQDALLADSVPVWAFWLTPEGRFQFFSTESERYTGKPAHYFMEHPAWLLRLVHPEDRKKFHQHREDLLLERHAVFDFRVIHPEDGSVYHLRHVCRPVYNADGQYLGRIGVNQDVTAFQQHERQLQARLQRFEVLYELTQRFASGLTAEMYARNVLQILQRYLDWHFAAIWQYDPAQDRFQVLAAMKDGALGDASLHQQIDRQVRTSSHGLVGAAVRERRSIRVGDVRKDSRYMEGGTQARSGLYVPMFSDGVPVGVLAVESPQAYAFSAEDLTLLESFAHTASAVLLRLQSLDELQQRLGQLEHLARLAALIRASDTPDDVLQMACQTLQDAFRLRLAVFFARQADGRFATRFVAGADGDGLPAFHLPADDALLQQVWESGQPVILPGGHPDVTASADASRWLQKGDSLAIWPLFDENELVGALGLVRQQPFSEAEQATIAMTAQMLGNAMARSRLLVEISGYASRLAGVNLLGQLLAEAPDLPTLYKRLLQAFQDLFPQAHALRLLRAGITFDSIHVVAWLDAPTVPVQFATDARSCPFWDVCRQCETAVQSPIEVRAPSDGTPERFWCLPFSLPGQTYGKGALQFALPSDVPISPQDQKLLQMIGRLTAAEVASQEYRQGIQQDAARWELLVRNGRDMAAAFSRENLYQDVYRTVREMFGCQHARLYLLDERQEHLRLVFSMPPDGAWAQTEILLSDDEKGEPFLNALGKRQPEFVAEDGSGRLYVPVLYGASAYGVMVLGWNDERPPAMSERQMIEALASQLTVLLRNFDLRESLEARLRHLESLRTIDAALISSTDPKVVLDLIIREIMRLAGADIVSVLYFDDEVRKFHYRQGRGYLSPAFTDLSGFTVESPAFQALITVQPVYVTTPEDWQQFGGVDLRLLAENVETAVYYPLVAKQTLQGVLEVCFRSEQTLDEGRKQFIETLAGQAAIAIDNFRLLDALERSNRELQMAYDETIEGWALALEMRDRETEGHTRRVTDLTVRLARRLGIPEDEIVHIRRGALLHDIGKMGIPDAILHKPGKLTDEEWQIMRKHPELALSFLSHIAYLRPALDIPYSHHEKWDGSGYPLGLKGEQIPLAARIFAIADVYDALATDRPYRKAWPREKVLAYIAGQAGKHFDPRIVQEFMSMLRGEE
jgi:PAS domain S-box-containing protein